MTSWAEGLHGLGFQDSGFGVKGFEFSCLGYRPKGPRIQIIGLQVPQTMSIIEFCP